MPADIDILVAGSSSIGYTPSYRFKNEIHDYDASSDILNSSIASSAFGSSSSTLDFPSLTSSSTSNSYLGTSPQIFSNSPPTHFTFHGRCSSPTLRTVPTASVSLSRNLSQLRLATSDGQQMPVAVPRRPCLVVRYDVLDLPSTTKNKKRVVFADDRGFPLALIRTMSEPSNVPPQLLNAQLFTKLNQVPNSESAVEPWEVTFPQPASDYLDFRRRLDINNVCLENVIVKENEQLVVGTVKVRNLDFHKEVFVRATSDGWKTQEDAFCLYVPNSPPSHGLTVLYDTFSFRLTLPPKSSKIEFCVCFKCSGTDFWDNNYGKNYVLKKESSIKRNDSSGNKVINPSVKSNTQLESWSEFASWNHLNINTPYW
ncbi:hypothetical protein RUM43_006919 [Polyplax serrata]|uniref:CBM21 domain-containing protein n=1 Tax=Polyplax serrata TaxID=468196 RepID=A0AAN8PLA1_POLSC